MGDSKRLNLNTVAAIGRLTHPSRLSSMKGLGSEHQRNTERLMHLDAAASVVPKGPCHSWRMEIVAITSFQLRQRLKEAKIKIILFSFGGAFRQKQHKWRLIFSPIDVAENEGEGKLTLRFPHERLRVLQHFSRNRLKLFSVHRAFRQILRFSCRVLRSTPLSPWKAPHTAIRCCETGLTSQHAWHWRMPPKWIKKFIILPSHSSYTASPCATSWYQCKHSVINRPMGWRSFNAALLFALLSRPTPPPPRPSKTMLILMKFLMDEFTFFYILQHFPMFTLFFPRFSCVCVETE